MSRMISCIIILESPLLLYIINSINKFYILFLSESSVPLEICREEELKEELENYIRNIYYNPIRFYKFIQFL